MTEYDQKITLLGSNVKIRNLPIKQVSLLEEGNLLTPAITLSLWLAKSPLSMVGWNSC